MKTLPSGGALATDAAAISPLVPGRLSTTTVRFSRSPMPAATRRASRSVAPPGGKPTTSCRGLSGKSESCALTFARGSVRAAASAARRLSWVMAGHARLSGTARKHFGAPEARDLRQRIAMFVKARDGLLHYDVVDQSAPWNATGETILFHHGIGSCAEMWRGWWPALIDCYRLLSFDMRGCGRSHVPPADFAWSLELLVDDVFAVADAAGAQRFHLVGESMGGTVALAAASARPERIATLTVSNGAHVGGSIEGVKAWRRQLDEGGPKAWSDAFMPNRFHDDALSPRQRAWFAAQQEQWSRDSILNALALLVGTDLSARLPEVRCPVLLLHPDGSPFVPVRVMADLHRLLPHAQLNVIGGARHGLPYSHAAQCAGLVRTFLGRHGVAASAAKLA